MLSKAIKIHLTLKCLERCYILNNSFNNRITLADFDGRNDKCIRVFPSVPISPNLPKVTIATEPRKYSKYNGYVVAETKTFCDICFFNPFTQTVPCRSLYLAEEAAYIPSVSLFLFFFLFRTLPSSDFFSCSHSKLEMLKISRRKRNLSFSLFLFLKTRGDWKRSCKRKNTEKLRKISKKRNPRGHIRITFKPRFTPLRRFSSSR